MSEILVAIEDAMKRMDTVEQIKILIADKEVIELGLHHGVLFEDDNKKVWMRHNNDLVPVIEKEKIKILDDEIEVPAKLYPWQRDILKRMKFANRGKFR